MKTTSTTQKILATLTLLAALMFGATNIQAALLTKADTTTMNTAADWGGTAPAAGSTGQFTAVISAPHELALALGGNVALDALTFTGTMNGPVNIASGSTLTMGAGASPNTFNLSAANQDVTVNCAVSLNNNGGDIINVASGRSLIFGGAVTFNQSSGNSIEFDGAGQVVITNTGFFSYPGQNLGFYIGNNTSPGTLVNYGTNSDLNGSSGGNMHLGHNNTGTSTFIMNGGTFSAHGNNGNPPMLIADTAGGTGVLTINKGAFNNIGPSGGIILQVGATAGATGILHLNGGLLGAYRITPAGGTGTAFFNGGTVRYINGSANTTFITGLNNAYISAGGLIVDGAYGQNVSIPQQLLTDTVTPSSGGGLTVRGTNSLGNGAPLLPSGQVVLNPGSGLAETYTGPTIINDNGELILTPTSLTTGVINSGSTLAFGSNYLGGGVLYVNGSGTSTQTFNGLNVWNGMSGITNNLNGATASTIALGAITRPSAANGVVPGGSIDFQGIGGTGLNGVTRITTSTANNPDGILGGWATVSNATWAINDGSGNIVGLPDASYTALPTSGGSSTANYNFASGSNPTGAIVANSLRIQNGTLALGANTITLNGDTGGLMLSSGNSSTITSSGAGCITVPSGKELIIDCGIAYGIGANSALTATGNTIGGTSTGITVSKTGPSNWNLNASGGAGPAFVGSLLIHQGTVSGNISSWGPTNVMIDAGARILLNSASLTFNGSVGGNGSIWGGSFTIGTSTAGSATIYPGGVGTPGVFLIGNSGGQTPVIGSGASFVFDLSSDPANPNANDQVVFGDTSGSATLPATLNITINELNGILGTGDYLLIDTRDNGGYTAAVSPTFIGTTPTSYSFSWVVSPEGKSGGALYLHVINPGNPCTTPGTPTIGTTTVGCSQLTVNWSGASGSGVTYNIWQSKNGGAYGEPIAKVQSGTSYVDATANDPTGTYTYLVAATNVTCGLMGLQSSASTGVMPNATPSVPVMSTSTVGCSQLTVNWNAATGGSGITYAVARSTGGVYTQIATNQSGTSFLDTGANNSGSTYTYEVSAINSSGCLSGYSTASTGASPAATPGAPSGVSAAAGNTTATVSWTTVGGLTYNIYRSTTSGGEGVTAYMTNVSEPFTDTGLTDGQIYYYEVTALNGTCESAPSTEVSATPNPAYSGYTITVSGGSTASTSAAGGLSATVAAVNSDGTTNTGVAGSISLTFGGLAASPSGQAPTFTALTAFSSGVATVTITTYDETNSAAVSVTDGTHATSSPGGAPLVLTVSPTSDSAYRITAATLTPATGAGDALTIKLVDQYQNLSAFSGNKTLNFSGLSAGPDGSSPTVTDKNSVADPFGSLNTIITFTSGVSTAGGSLVAHKAESGKLLAATDGTLSTTTTGGSAPTLSPTFGNAATLGVIQQPSSPDAAGSAFVTQPKVGVFDTYSNAVTTSIASITATAATGTLLGTTSVNAVNGTGVASFTNLQLNKSGTNTLTFSGSGLTSTNSVQITVNGGTAVGLAWATQPAGASSGSPLVTQPVLKTVDAFGNPSTTGLPTNQTITVSLQGSGALSGTTNYNIGSQGSNGVVTFTDLTVTGGSGSQNLTASTVPLAVQAIATNAPLWMDAVAQNSLSFSAGATVSHWNNLGSLGGQSGVPGYTDSGTFTGPADTQNIINGKPVVRFTATANGNSNNGGNALTNGWPTAGALDSGPNITVFFVGRQPGNPTGDWDGYISFGLPGVTSGKDNRTLDSDSDNPGGGFANLVNRWFRNDNIASPTSGASGQSTLGQALNGSWLDARPANGNAFVNTFYFTNSPTAATAAGANYWKDSAGNVGTNYQGVTLPYGNFAINEFGLGGQLGWNGGAANNDHIDWCLSMDVAEVLVFTNQMTAADQGTIYAYLQNKWFNNSGVNWYSAVYSNAVSQSFTESVTPAFSALTPSQAITAGTSSITLTGKLSAAGPVYPANGETVTVTINGNAQNTTINDSTGDFSINYNPSTIPASGTPYPITYSYAGNGSLAPASDSSTALTVEPAYSGYKITDAGSGSATAGSPDILTLTAVDNTGATVTGVAGPVPITFGGLASSPGGTAATYGGQPATVTLTFTNGQVTTTLLAYDATNSATVTAADNNSHTTSSPGGASLTLTVSVAADTAYRISAATTTPVVAVGDALTITIVDPYQNVSSFSGNKTITFGGLSAGPDGSLPTVTDKNALPVNQGTGAVITFTSGINTAGGSLVAHKVESGKLLAASDGSLNALGTIGTAPTLSPTVGAPGRLGINTQPSATGLAGSALAQQPVITVLDLYGNPTTSSSTPVSVSAAVGAVTGTFPTNSTGGVATFSGLALSNTGTNTLTFSSGGLISTNSTVITIAAGPYKNLAWVTQPGAAVYGSAFGTQPVLATVDQFGNPTTNGLAPSLTVTVSKSSGPGTLSGTTSYNIGTSGSNGVVSFSDLAVTNATGTNYQLTAAIPAGYGSPVLGMAVWLDSSVGSSVLTSGGNVQQWNDLSGNNNNFGLAAGSGNITYAGTLNGLSVVSFPTGPALLTTNNAYTFTGSNMTLFCVVRQSSAASFTGPFSSTSGANANDWNQSGSWSINTGGSDQPGFQRFGQTISSSTTITANKAFIWQAADDSVGNLQYVGYDDGTVSNIVSIAPATQGPFSVVQLSVGARMQGTNLIMNPWNGDVAEVLLYNSYLSTPQQSSVMSYLNNKWFAPSGSFTPPASAASATFTVAPAPITVTNGITANSKLYDGTTNATLNIGTVGFTGVFPQDIGIIGLNASGAGGYFANAGPGVNIPVTVTNILITGSDATNYFLVPLVVSGNITAPVAGFGGFTITDAGAGSATVGVGDQLTITTETNGLVATNVTGNVTVTFSGMAAAPDGSLPTVTDYTGTPQPFGSSMILYFTNGVASLAGEGVLVAHKAQTASPHITNGSVSDGSSGGSTVSITVSAGPDSAYRISATTSTPAVAASDALSISLVDQYQNPSSYTGNKSLTFSGLSAGPDGSLPTVSDKFTIAVNQGTPTTIAFTSGVSTAGGSLVAHKVESGKLLAATDGTLSTTSTGGTAPTLSPVAGSPGRLGISTQPSSTVAAGAVLAQQPVITVLDVYGNPTTSSSTSVSVSAAVGSVTGAFPTNSTGGVATFSGLALTGAGTNTLTFSSGILSSTNSSVVTVSPGAYAGIAWITQPGGAVYGSPFGIQPVLATADQFGNATTTGIPGSLTVNVTKTSGPGTLSGTLTYNIGSSGSNGVVKFTDLAVTNATGTNYQLTAATPSGSGSPVSGMAVWLDASVASSVITSGGNVTQWNDLSGNNYNFGLLAGSGNITYASTLNGLKVVSFPNGPALLTTNNAYTYTGSNVTIFCVVRQTSVGAFQGPFSSSQGANANDWNQSGSWSLNSGNSGQATFQRFGQGVNSPTTFTAGKPFIWLGADDAVGDLEYAGYDDGSVSNVVSTPPDTQGPFSVLQLSVGARMQGTNLIMNPWNGDVAEVLLYHSYLSTAQQAAVMSYLNNKWLTNSGFAPPVSATTATFTVAPALITITNGITANNKMFDGGTNVTLTIGTVGFTGVFPQDLGIIGLNAAGAGGYFASAGPGNNIPVIVTNIVITGSDATNYILAPLVLSANITSVTPTYNAFVVTNSGPGNLTAGVGSQLIVSVVDNTGTVVSGYNGNITVTLSGLAAHQDRSLPTVTDKNGNPVAFGTSMALNFVNGVASQANGAGVLVAHKAETASPHITDGTATDGTTGGSTISLTVVSGSPAGLGISVQPSATATAATAFAQQPVITVLDAYGNVVATSSASVNVSAAVGNVFGTFPINASSGVAAFSDLSLTNLGTNTLTFTSGSFSTNSTVITVSPAALTMTLSSSENPSGYHDSVSFTGTVSPSVAGSLVFATNGVPFDTEPLSGGSATSAATTALARGTTTVTATFTGNPGYVGSTNLTGGQVVTNHPPVLNAANYTRIAGLELELKISDLLTNASDADADPLILGYVTPSTNGTTLSDDGTYIYYTNSSPANVSDAFNYYVNDSFGGLTTNTVFLTVDNSQTGAPNLQVHVVGGQTQLSFGGLPGYLYYLQRSTNLVTGTGWVPISTNTTTSNVVFNVIDTFSDLPAKPNPSFYRVFVP